MGQFLDKVLERLDSRIQFQRCCVVGWCLIANWLILGSWCG